MNDPTYGKYNISISKTPYGRFAQDREFQQNMEAETLKVFPEPLAVEEFEYNKDFDMSKVIVIGGVGYPRTPDPDRTRKLLPPKKPIVMYCGTKYYLINSAKLQMVKNLKCIVGISQKVGNKLLQQSQTKKENK